VTLCPEQLRQDVIAVLGRVVRKFRADDFRAGCHHISEACELVAGGIGFDLTGPADDEWGAAPPPVSQSCGVIPTRVVRSAVLDVFFFALIANYPR